MAQTGFTPIQLYSSSTASAVPTSGNLVAGELAINTADGKLFYLDNLNAVQVIAWKSIPVTVINATGTPSSTTFLRGDGSWATPSTVAGSVVVGTTAITSGTSGRILYDNAGTLGELTTTGTGSVVLNTNPSISGGATIDATTQAIAIGGSQSTGAVTIGGTGATGAITIGRSTGTQTINIGTGNNTGTKFINIGTASSTGANLVTIGKLSTTVAHDTKLYGQSVTVEASTSLNLTAQNMSLNTPYIYMPNSFGQNQVFVADLPTDFPTPQAGDRAFVQDALARVFGQIVSGGGAFVTPIFYDGTDWRVG